MSPASEGAAAAMAVLMPLGPVPFAAGEVALLAADGEVAAAIVCVFFSSRVF